MKKRKPKKLIEVSLRPYNGRLFVAPTKEIYESAHKRLFKEPDVLDASQAGRFSGGCGKDDMWTYLVWPSNHAYLAHELAHVAIHVFHRCNIPINHGNDEAFCYFLSQLMLDSEVCLK